MKYGGHLTLATLASFLFLQIDNASVGKWLGLRALGFYAIAFTTCNMPATNLTSVVNRVMFPTYSKLNGNTSEIRQVYLKTMKHLSSVAFPAAAVLMTLPEPFIRVFYGQKWEGAIPLFHILAIYGLLRSIGATSQIVFMAVGRPELVRRVSLTQLLLGASLVYPVAMRFGVTGVATLFTFAYIAGTSYGLFKVQRLLEIPASRWFGTIKAPALSAFIAGAAGWLMISNTEPSWANIALDTAIVVGGYGLSVFLMDRTVFTDLKSMVGKPVESGT